MDKKKMIILICALVAVALATVLIVGLIDGVWPGMGDKDAGGKGSQSQKDDDQGSGDGEGSGGIDIGGEEDGDINLDMLDPDGTDGDETPDNTDNSQTQQNPGQTGDQDFEEGNTGSSTGNNTGGNSNSNAGGNTNSNTGSEDSKDEGPEVDQNGQVNEDGDIVVNISKWFD